MSRCARCDWQHDPDDPARPREQLVAHATDAAHPLCIICHASLTRDEQQTCETGADDRPSCLQQARTLLSGIRTMHDAGTRDMGRNLGSSRFDSDRPNAADGRPLLGGDLLVLLGPGSDGWSEDGETSKPGDVMSLAYEMLWWAEDWQDRFNDPVSRVRPRSSAGQFHAACGYLERHMRRASREHPAFDEFAEDLRRMHSALEQATGRARRASTANEACFDCGGPLARPLVEVTIRQWWLPGSVGPLPPHHPTLTWTGLVEEEDRLTCSTCGRVYLGAAYNLAVRARVEAASRRRIEGEEYTTLVVAAGEIDRSPQVIRDWMAQGTVRRVTVGGVLFVHLADAEEQNRLRPRRAKRSA